MINDIFISYQWDSKDTIVKIQQKLESEKKYKIWLDTNEMRVGKDIYKDMENGINSSKLFLAFITQKYCESNNCQLEIKYVNSLRGDHQKKIIYVMLEEINVGKDLDGVGLLTAGSLKLNAYDFMKNSNTWFDSVYEVLEKAVYALLNEIDLPRSVVHSIPVDFKSLIKCMICKQFYNMMDESHENCAKPMLISCNEYLCYKCIKERKLNSDTFLCPFDGNEHLMSNLTNATRLQKIIQYLNIKDMFTKLKTNTFTYDYEMRCTLVEINSAIKNYKHSIEENIEEVIEELYDYKTKLFQQLDEYVALWKKRRQSTETKFNLNDLYEVLNPTEVYIKKIEDDLKLIEISIFNKINQENIEKLLKKVDENISKLETSVNIYNKNLAHACRLMDDVLRDLEYINGSKLIDFKETIGEIKTHDLLLSKTIKHTKFKTIQDICFFDCNNQIVLSDINCVHLIDATQLDYIKEIRSKYTIEAMCCINDEQLLCGLIRDNGIKLDYTLLFLNRDYSIQSKVKLNGILLKEVNYTSSPTFDYDSGIQYISFASKEKSYKINVSKFDRKFKLLKLEAFESDSENSQYTYTKVFDSQLFIVTSSVLYLFDMNFNLVKKFQTSSIAKPIFIDACYRKIVLILFENEINLYDSSLNFIRIIEYDTKQIKTKSGQKSIVFDDKIILFSNENNLDLIDYNTVSFFKELML